MQTGENEQSLRKIVDMTRLISLVILALHIYYYCYAGFVQWKWNVPLLDKIMGYIVHTGLFSSFHFSKIIALLMLVVSLVAAKGKKSEKLNYRTSLAYLITGVLLYFISGLALEGDLQPKTATILYILITATGYILILTGGTFLSRILTL
jgi:hypothetical protein